MLLHASFLAPSSTHRLNVYLVWVEFLQGWAKCLPRVAGLEKLLQDGLSGPVILFFTSLLQEVEPDRVLLAFSLLDLKLIDLVLEGQVTGQLRHSVAQEVHLHVYVILAGQGRVLRPYPLEDAILKVHGLHLGLLEHHQDIHQLLHQVDVRLLVLTLCKVLRGLSVRLRLFHRSYRFYHDVLRK